MPDLTTPPAAGQPDTPTPTISAARDAANKNDFSAFDKADRAARIGKPLAAVETKVESKVVTPPVTGPADGTPPAAGSGQPPVSTGRGKNGAPEQTTDADRRADEKIRTRVAEAVAERDTKIADLERRLAETTTGRREAVPPKAEAPAPVTEKFPTLVEYGTTHPDATLEEYLDARDTWRDQRREAATRERTAAEQHGRMVQDRTGRFMAALETAKAADPDVFTKINEVVDANGFKATPLSGCPMNRSGDLIDPQTGKPATFRSVVAEVALRSENGVALLTYLHAHPAEVTRITGLPVPDWFEALTRLDGRVAAAGPPASPPAREEKASPVAVPSTITAAPPPVPTLSRVGSTIDPKKAALTRGDFGTFDKLEMQEKRAQRMPA